MSGFDMVGYSKSPQAVRQEGIPEPKKLIFTELPPKFDNPWCAAYSSVRAPTMPLLRHHLPLDESLMVHPHLPDTKLVR